MKGEVTLEILLVIGFAIPLVGALWHIFAIRESLSREIRENAHKIDINEQEQKTAQLDTDYRLKLMEQYGENLADKLLLGIHETKELVGHVRSRSAKAETDLNRRTNDIESYLEKSTEFVRRRSE